MARVRFGVVIAAALAILISPRLGMTATAALTAGEAAPSFSLPDTQGRTQRFDKSSTQTLLLVFAKPNDRYAGEAFAALNKLLGEKDIIPKGGVRRVAILSRFKAPAQAAPVVSAAGPAWRVLLDAGDVAYHDYKIIATPTIMLVGPDKTVVISNPGFDHAMPTRIREGLIKIMGPSRPKAETPPPPYMPLQIARHLAGKKLWDNALVYYLQAEKEGRLPPEGRLELAEVYLEMNQLDKAKQTLAATPVSANLAARKSALEKRIRKAEQQTRSPKTSTK